MKKIYGILLTAGLVAVLGVTGYSANTTAQAATKSPDISESMAEKAWDEYAKEAVLKKKFEAYNEAFNQFDINDQDYNYYPMYTNIKEFKELSTKSAFSLKKAVYLSLSEQGDIKTGDIAPGLFIKHDGSEAFVLFKSSDNGENHIYWYNPNKENDAWNFVDKKQDEGKVLEKLKLTPFKEFKQNLINNSN